MEEYEPPSGLLEMLNTERASYHLLVGTKGMDSPFFILSHEAAVTLYVCTQDGTKFAFKFLCGHGVSSKNSKIGRKK
jgi:hypothetical protein